MVATAGRYHHLESRSAGAASAPIAAAARSPIVGREGPAEGRLLRRHRRRPLEDHRRRRDLGADHRRPDHERVGRRGRRVGDRIPTSSSSAWASRASAATSMPGDGVYKSTDAGKTWTHVGFENSDAISKIRIHPTNPEHRVRRRLREVRRRQRGARRLQEHRRRQDVAARCCTRTTRRAPSTSRSTRTIRT